jgi:curved DNA-binding protein CbpA
MKFRPSLIVAVGICNILSMIVTTCLKAATTSVSTFTVVDAKKAPELTSTALKVHKVYTVFLPHDTDLYDIMEVSPNATLALITKSYRNLSRQYHPDKQGRRQQQQPEQNSRRQDSAEQRLQQIQTAYEILSNDSKRMLYHRYGMIDPNLAAFLLLGPRVSPTNYYQLIQQQQHSHSSSFSGSAYGNTAPLFDKLDREVLHLMGYDESSLEVLAMATESANSGDGTDPSVAMEEHRVRTVAALLLESIRPLVEGRLDTSYYTHLLSQDCDRWKRLPLGAQIIRSVGRAYRHEGREFLQRLKNNKMEANSWKSRNNNANKEKNVSTKQLVLQLQTDLSIGFRQRWRSTKGILEAAAVSGRLAMAERSFNEQERKQKQQQFEKQRKKKEVYKTIEYNKNEYDHSTSDTYLPQMEDFIFDDDDNYESLEDLEEEQKELEKLKAQQSLLQTLQIEALWKVCKIDLDRIVRRACGMILSGEYFFYPSHQSSSEYCTNPVGSSNGWVTSSGRTIDSERAKVAAAEAMIMTGEIMVQQSKQGTSWKQ